MDLNPRKYTSCLAVLALGLSGCATGPYYHYHSDEGVYHYHEGTSPNVAPPGSVPANVPVSGPQTATGAAIGGILGAGIGVFTVGGVPAAAIGLGIGSILGASIGNAADRNDLCLQNKQGLVQPRITQAPVYINRVHTYINFDFDKDQVKPAYYTALNNVALTLKQNPNTVAQVIGHADNSGTSSYNQDLSQRRAQSVANYLIDQGVAKTQINIIAAGHDKPVASNSTVTGKAQNRRVEIDLIS